MKLRHLTDQSLLNETLRLVRQERELLAIVLWHLREIESRRLFSALGYPSLFEYARQELGYSEDQAQRRITAMRMMKELPEIEGKICSGALSLTNIGLASALFRKEECTREEKIEIFSQIEDKSKKEAEKVLVQICPELPRKERVRPISPGRSEIRFNASEELLEKMARLKGALAHKHPGLTFEKLFEKLCDLGLETWDKGKEPALARAAPSQAAVHRELHRREKCENCGSRYALQIDHRKPKALGGKSTRENLRLLCRSCNQRAAIEKLGQEKMDPYLNPSSGKRSGKWREAREKSNRKTKSTRSGSSTALSPH